MAICNNKKCSIGECNQAETCSAYIPVVTNADCIRSMSDEELASFIKQKKLCPDETKHKGCVLNCGECWLEWLQQQVEDKVTY